MFARSKWQYASRLCCAAVLATFGAAAQTAEISGYGAITSDYVKRGVTQSDGNPALQLGVDLSFINGFYTGAWASTVDIENGPSRSRDQEVNLYAGYAVDISPRWRLSANIVSYSYPGQTGDTDYDYEEYTVGINYDDRIWLEYSYSPDLYDSDYSTDNFDLYLEWPLDQSWSVGAGGGYYDASDLTGSAYWYWQIGATRSFRFVDLDIRFHDSSRWVSIVSSPERDGARVALTIRVPF